MLEVLRIQNYALIDELEIEFGHGFNVLTGETGAGKSIVVGALNLVLGGRASSEIVREGAARAQIDAVFRTPKPPPRLEGLLEQHDIPLEDGEVMLSRVVTAEGRSRAYVCGRLVPIAVLASVGDELVDIHGQHEHQSLLKVDRQLDLLDAFAGADGQRRGVSEMVSTLRDLDKAVAEMEGDDRERGRRVDYLKYEISEIDKAGLGVGEEEDLKARRNLITNAEQIFTLTSEVRALLYEGDDNAAVSAVDGALSRIEELASIDEGFRDLAGQLTEVRALIEGTAEEVRARAAGIEFDPEELDRVNQRLAAIGDLKRKYGGSVKAIVEYRERAAAEVDAFEARDERLAEMHAEREALNKKALAAASKLSAKRRAAAKKLDRQVTAALQALGMKGGRFETGLEGIPLTLSGADRVVFLLTANPGEKVKALRQVASGGEISRIMLALKAVFAGADRIPTLIFDEIDAGVGGHIARSVADKLRELADSHQTICVTHIAHIAAAAQHHYHVSKSTDKKRTTTKVAQVVDAPRAQEVARLLDGSVSELSLKHARALIEESP